MSQKRMEEKIEPLKSGMTENINKMVDEWEILYDETEDEGWGMWSCDTVEENPQAFLDEIGKLKVIPAYRYTVIYILSKYQIVLNEYIDDFLEYLDSCVKTDKIPSASPMNVEIAEKRGKELLEKIEQESKKKNRSKKEKENKMSEGECEVVLTLLLIKLKASYLKNGYTRCPNWKKVFRRIWEGFDFKSFREFALGIHMSLEDANRFLYQVLKRSGINRHDREEVLFYLVLKYAEEYNMPQFYTAYQKLLDLYPKKNEKEESGDVTSLKNTIDFSNNSSQIIEQELEKVINEIMEKASEELFNKRQEKLAEYLDVVDKIKIRNRTARKRAFDLWERLRIQTEKVEDEIDEDAMSGYCERDHEVVREALMENVPSDRRELTVLYDAEKSVIIPEGLEFSADTRIVLGKGRENISKVVLKVPEKIELPSVEWEQVEVRVKALTQDADINFGAEIRNELNNFVTDDFLNNSESKISVIDNERLQQAISDIEIGRKDRIRFWAVDGKKNEGTLCVTCKAGTFIPQGTMFAFEWKGIIFQYESIEASNGHTIEIGVNLTTDIENNLMENREALPVYIEKEEFELEEKERENVLTAYVGKNQKIDLLSGGTITVECRKGCKISREMKFKYHCGEHEFIYQPVEDFEVPVYAVGIIEVEWINEEENQKIVEQKESKGESELLSAGYRFDVNLRDVYEVFSEKRFALKKNPLSKKRTEEEAGEIKEKERSYIRGNLFCQRIYDINSEENADSIDYYKGIPERGDDYFLNTQLFKETRITKNLISELRTKKSLSEERIRNLILTLKFYEFFGSIYVNNNLDSFDKEQIMESFIMVADDELTQCGFWHLDKRFPYDAFFLLLINSIDPLMIFQSIWSDQDTGILKGGTQDE